MNLTPQQSADIVNEEDGNFETVEDQITAHRRWSVVHRIVVRKKDTGLLYAVKYSVGATESQDEEPFQFFDGPVEWKEVKAVQKTVTIYE